MQQTLKPQRQANTECSCEHCAINRFENNQTSASAKEPIQNNLFKQFWTKLITPSTRILVSGILFVIGVVLSHRYPSIYATAFLFFAYAIIGSDIVIGALKNIFSGHLLDEKFLMSIASLGAFGVGQIPEGVAVMLFYQIGEAFNDYAITKSKKSIEKLMELKPDIAHKIQGNTIMDLSPEQITVGDYILIRSGERIPLDAIVTEGESTLNVSALTGESLPLSVKKASQLLSGAVNQTGILKACVTKTFSDSTFSRILEMVENSSKKKAKSELFIKKFAHYYTPIVVLAAVLTTAIPVAFFQGDFSTWFYRSLMFLVVSCPCALVLSVPLAFFGGIGAASRNGILIKGGSFIEQLAKTATIVFDKTGTLTKGTFFVTNINVYNFDENKALEIAAQIESLTTHPIGQSIVTEYTRRTHKKILAPSINTSIKETFGKGITGIIDSKKVLVGKRSFLTENNITLNEEPLSIQNSNLASSLYESTLIYVALEGVHIATIYIGDTLKTHTKDSIQAIKKMGIKRIVMLSGDKNEIAHSIAAKIGIDEVHAELLPSDKVVILEKILSKSQTTVFVGDGINDAPSLARADIGIAMGALGSDAAIEASDIVIMGEELTELPVLIKISKKTLRIAKQNIIFAISVKILIMSLAVFGLGSMWLAVFGDVGVSILAVINSLRLILKSN